MDRAQEEFQNLGCYGIFKQSFKLITQWKKIFSQITLALIVPLSLTLLARAHISKYLIDSYMSEFDESDYDMETQTYTNLPIFFEFVYATFLIIFSLLSTSAVVYTIACIYSAKETTFNTVMSVVPRVWKRLLLTFVIGYVILSAMLLLTFFFWLLILNQIDSEPIGIALTVVIWVAFGLGFGYVYIIWNMASVVSVLEEINVIGAMKKSKILISDHLGVSILLFVLQAIAFAGISSGYQITIMDPDLKSGIKVLIGVSYFQLLVIGFLMVLVIQTVIYFVCKSYHHEYVDRNSLADHLEANYGAYVPLNDSKEVQLESA